jgi:hypothetical protein
MSKFRIEPHGRLQEWFAEEKGYFRDEGLDYEFVNSWSDDSSLVGFSDLHNSSTEREKI